MEFDKGPLVCPECGDEMDRDGVGIAGLGRYLLCDDCDVNPVSSEGFLPRKDS